MGKMVKLREKKAMLQEAKPLEEQEPFFDIDVDVLEDIFVEIDNIINAYFVLKNSVTMLKNSKNIDYYLQEMLNLLRFNNII